MKILNSKLDTFHSILCILGIISLAAFIVPIFAAIFNVGNITGIIISLIIIYYSIYHKNIINRLKTLYKQKIYRIIIILTAILIIIIAITAIVLSSLMIKEALNKPASDSKAVAVILGCKVNGEEPSLMLKRRLDTAVKYLNENKEIYCIVSGGQGPNEGISEAHSMFNYLVKNGIDENRIFIEDKSHDTEQNIKFSKDILNQNGLGNEIIIITDGFHILRAKTIAQKEGITSYSIPARTVWFAFPTFYIRELYALLEEFLLK